MGGSEVQDSAAASELAASAAQLRLLMQKLISTRLQGGQQQSPVNADITGQQHAEHQTTEAASTAAAP